MFSTKDVASTKGVGGCGCEGRGEGRTLRGQAGKGQEGIQGFPDGTECTFEIWVSKKAAQLGCMMDLCSMGGDGGARAQGR